MLDFAIAKIVNEFGRGTFVDSLSEIISSYFFLVAVFALVVILILVKDRRKFKFIFLALIIALIFHILITGVVMKGFVAENVYFKERPYVAYPNEIVQLGEADKDTAFPSGHVALTLGILTVLVFYYRKYWHYALAFALLMAFSRIHNGMHYPSDVLFGALFGIVYGLSAVYIARMLIKKR